MAKKIILELDEAQAATLRNACEFVGRIHMGQFDVIKDLPQIDKSIPFNYFLHMKELLMGLTDGSYHAIHSDKIPDQARQLFDIYQVLRHKIAYDQLEEGEKPNIGSSVIYDPPMNLSTKCQLPTCDIVEEEEK